MVPAVVGQKTPDVEETQRRRREREAASVSVASVSLVSMRPNAVLIPALPLEERGTVVRRLRLTER